tara:strand:+ start:2320 stop:3327 length:1008 start_codon:yes stop_codon:yes gene_type:complete
MVRTGANAYVRYGFESAYKASVGSPTNSFGLKTAVTGWTLTTNRTALAKLGQVEVDTFAYGQQQGSLSLGFVLGDTTSHKLFQAIYGTGTDGTPSTTQIYGGTTARSTTNNLIGNTLAVEIAANLETANSVRTLRGGILNTLSISASVGDVVNATADITYGKEDAPSTSFSAGNAPTEDSKPFTFAHGTVNLRTASGTEVIAELQEADINWTQNSDLLYTLGDNQAATAIKRVLEITGRFRASWKDNNKVNALINQMKTGGAVTHKETWGDAYAGGGSDIEFKLTFATGDGKSITIELAGMSFMDHAVSGMEPVEPLFEELNWQAKFCKVTAVPA